MGIDEYKIRKYMSSSIDKTLLMMTDTLHVSLYIEQLMSESMTLIFVLLFFYIT